MAIHDELKTAAETLKAQVDTLQTKMAAAEAKIADIMNGGGIPAEIMISLQETRDLLVAEAADVEADNADS